MANGLVSLLLVILFSWSAGKTITKFSNDNLGMSATSAAYSPGICQVLVSWSGFVCLEHLVITKDGYVLSMQRIRKGSSYLKESNRPPVLLQHGLLMDGTTWLLLPPKRSLAFLLADDGFDVWLGNSRGTKYSRGHKSLSPNDPAYWDWTWDELVVYDLPAMFQYVYKHTGHKLHYVGHSMGTLMLLASFSKMQMQNMLKSAALLCPIAYVGQLTSPLARNAADNFIAETLYWLGLHEFKPRGEDVIKFLKDICRKPDVDCTHLLTSFTGQNCCLDPSIVDIFLDHEPQSTSTKNIIHLSQTDVKLTLVLRPVIRQGTTEMYNYGDPVKNLKHYGQPAPPVYNLTSIPSYLPLFLSYGGADALSDVKDVQMLLGSLNDHEKDKLVVQYIKDFAHADYVMSENAKPAIYDPLISFFRRH